MRDPLHGTELIEIASASANNVQQNDHQAAVQPIRDGLVQLRPQEWRRRHPYGIRYVHTGCVGWLPIEQSHVLTPYASFRAKGMTVQRLSAAVMESLINCGWARSGMWLYRPTNSRTCCPNYAVRFES